MAREIRGWARRRLVTGVVRGARQVHGGKPRAVSCCTVVRGCWHLGADLANGSVDRAGCLVCPWHGARYNIATGRMTRGPRASTRGSPVSMRATVGSTRVLPAGTRCAGGRKGAVLIRQSPRRSDAVAFDEVVEKIAEAARHIEADGERLALVLVAVVREFEAKLAKAEEERVMAVPGRDFVIELERAGRRASGRATERRLSETFVLGRLGARSRRVRVR